MIEKWIDYQVYIKELPGVSVGIFVEDEVIFQKDYGYANLDDKTKLTNNHLFRIASHSKLFTATAIMKLYNEDKLSLDDKISKHLPWFTNDLDDHLDQIRIHHLLTHSSGITRDGETGHWEKYIFPNLNEIKEQVKKGISYFEPSEQPKYSNYGYTLLGLIIEVVSEQSYEAYVTNEIFQPLDMHNTYVDLNESNISNHATGYSRKLPGEERSAFPHIKANVMHAATGLSSTVDDIIQFYKAHIMGNNDLFPDYIKREMHRTQYKNKNYERGLSFGKYSVGSLKTIGHVGDYPGYTTCSQLIPDKKIITVVFINSIDGPAFEFVMGIEGIIDTILKDVSKFQKSEDEQHLNLEHVLGFYANDWGTILFSQIGNKLISISPDSINPIDFAQIMKHKESLEFIYPNNLVFWSPGGETMKFEKDDKGESIVISRGAENERFHYSY